MSEWAIVVSKNHGLPKRIAWLQPWRRIAGAVRTPRGLWGLAARPFGAKCESYISRSTPKSETLCCDAGTSCCTVTQVK